MQNLLSTSTLNSQFLLLVFFAFLVPIDIIGQQIRFHISKEVKEDERADEAQDITNLLI